VPPERIVDYLSLIGDTVDKRTGVRKVRAEDALNGSRVRNLDGIVAHADEIKGAVGDNLRKLCLLPWRKSSLPYRRSAIDGRRSRRSRKRFPRGLRPATNCATCYTPGSRPAAEVEMRTVKGLSTPARPPPKWSGITTRPDVGAIRRMLARINAAELTSFDTETTALDPMVAQLSGCPSRSSRACGLYSGRASRTTRRCKLPRDEVLQKLKSWLEDPSKKKSAQHLKYDEQVLANYEHPN